MASGAASDYTLFLLSAAREHHDATSEPERPRVRRCGHQGGGEVVAAARVMVAVILALAIFGGLTPKEMGGILAVAVFLDALCIRLIVLPVVFRLTGHAAWHTPGWLTRTLPTVRCTH